MSFWEDSKVLVTGGASFIGSHLVQRLLDDGAIVTVADDFSSGTMDSLTENDFRDGYEKRRLIISQGDLASREFTRRASQDQNVVFHLAASHGGRGYIDGHPVECCRNMLLDQMVFSIAADCGVERICYASSACVYPRHLQKEGIEYLLKEDDVSLEIPGKAQADREYGWAKLMGEMSMRAYNKQHGIKTSSARIFTAYGPRENETHSVTALIAKAFIHQEPYEIWGDGQQDRNFTYVDDIVRGLILLAEKIEDGEAVNLGMDRHLKIIDLAELICEAMNWHPEHFQFRTDKPVGVMTRAADPTLAQSLLGWTPRIDFKEGVRRTVEWYMRTKNPITIRSRLQELLTERKMPEAMKMEV